MISKTSILEYGPRVRRAILLTVIAGVPLFFLRFTNDPFNVPKLALLTAGLGTAGALRVIEGLQGASWKGLRRLLLPAALILVPLTLAWVFAPYRYWSLLGEYKRFQGLVPYALVILLGILVADAFRGRIRELGWAFVLGGAVVGGYSILQSIGMDPFDWATTSSGAGSDSATTTLGNPNFTGGYLAVCLPLALGLWREGGARHELAFRALPLIVIGEILSFSQGGYAASVAGLAVFAGFYFERDRRLPRLLGAGAAVAVVLAVLAVVVFAMMRPDTDLVPLTTKQRALWWRGALNMTQEHPIVGRGPNAYAVEGVQHRPIDDSSVHGLDFSDDTHSVPLALLTSAGLLGLFGFLGVIAWSGYQGARLPSGDLVAAGLAAAVAAYFVQSLVSIDELSLRVSAWALLGGLASAGALPKTDRPKKTQRKRKSRPPRVEPVRARHLVIVALIVGLGFVSLGVLLVRSDVLALSARRAFAGGDLEGGDSRFESARSLYDFYNYRHLHGFHLGAAALRSAETGEDPSRWIDGMTAAYAYLDDFPSLGAMRDYGNVLWQLRSEGSELRDRAADVFERTLSLDPYNVTLVSEGIPILIEAERHQRVVELLAPRMDVLGEGDGDLWAHLALAYHALGRGEEAQDALSRAVAIAPEDLIVIDAAEQIERGN